MDDKPNDNKITIELTIDDMMTITPININKYVKYKIDNIKNKDKIIDKKILKNIYIDSKYRLSTKIKKYENIKLVKDKEEEVACQMLILHMMKAIPSGNTIIETGECRKDGEDYLYVIALDDEIISFIRDCKDMIESIYFSKNIEKNCNNNLLNNKIYSSGESNIFNNKVPYALIDCSITKKYGGVLIPSIFDQD